MPLGVGLVTDQQLTVCRCTSDCFSCLAEVTDWELKLKSNNKVFYMVMGPEEVGHGL